MDYSHCTDRVGMLDTRPLGIGGHKEMGYS